MRTRQETDLGCGKNKAKDGGRVQYCQEHGLDFHIYKLGRHRIKKMVQRRYGIILNTEGKGLDAVTREAMEIAYQ